MFGLAKALKHVGHSVIGFVTSQRTVQGRMLALVTVGFKKPVRIGFYGIFHPANLSGNTRFDKAGTFAGHGGLHGTGQILNRID